ncbi:MAG: hypothetical protein HRT89_06345 [Lentisphaeria bacterium]|nr:hypothetical protein [Lentisphaeria bacterium]
MIELSKLGEMLSVASYDELMDDFELVGEPLEEGPWPMAIPSKLSDKLMIIEEDEIISVCAKWVEIEEFYDSDKEGLSQYIKELKEFLNANPAPFFLVNAL